MSVAIGFVVGIGSVLGVTIIFIAGAWYGFYAAAADAQKRLTREEPVDAFWRERGMR